MSSVAHSSAIRALTLELKSLKDEPLEGFRVRLLSEENLFDWEVAIFGPPGTIYEGGYFKARMRFPTDYPYNPPTLRFDKSTLYHPNVYESGELCISILHPPIDDPQSGELPCERWNPTQSVRTILLSVVSLLNEPNTSSPANVDASLMYRKWKDSFGADKEYETIVKRQVTHSQAEAKKDGVVVPMTLEEYIIKPRPSHTKSSAEMDFYDDEDYFDMEDDEVSSTNDSQVVASEESSVEEGSAKPTSAPSAATVAGKGGEKFDELTPETNQNQYSQDEKAAKDSFVYTYKFRLTYEKLEKSSQN